MTDRHFLTLTMPNFLNEISVPTFLALSIISFRYIKMKTWRWSSNSRAGPDCTDVQAGLALYWWQRLITFGVSRIRVNWWKKDRGSYSFYLEKIWTLVELFWSTLDEQDEWSSDLKNLTEMKAASVVELLVDTSCSLTLWHGFDF